MQNNKVLFYSNYSLPSIARNINRVRYQLYVKWASWITTSSTLPKGAYPSLSKAMLQSWLATELQISRNERLYER